MTFFDKKEEVISVELTQYGKYLLSKGKFKPFYYDFIDDDVLYDSKYGNFEESNSNISNRIRNETPSIKPQYVFSGIESKIKEITLSLRNINNNISIDNIQQTPERQYFSAAALGNADLFSKYCPSWNINLLKGKIESVIQNKSNSNISNPEIILQSPKFKIKTANTNQDLVLQPDEFVSKVFDDSSYIRIIGDSLIIELKEENVPVMNSNFDVELYIQETDTETLEEKLIPLYFNQKNSSIVNNLLVGDGTEEQTLDSANDQKSAEYFFTINIDNQISEEVKEKMPESKQRELQIIPTNNNFIKSSE